MPELSCSIEVGPAISEPVQLADGRILLAAETAGRDVVEVFELALRPTSADRGAGLAVLPGGPTDNGTRAQYPRLAARNSDWQVAYQHGSRTRIAGERISADCSEAYGVWPIAVRGTESPWEWQSAPPTTSQGIFGYFAGRWWTFDDIWQTRFQTEWTHLGRLFHAWVREAGTGAILHFLYKHNSGTVLRMNGSDGYHSLRKVFDGQSEHPRGCTLADGRILVVALGERTREVAPGQWLHRLRVAVSPFEPFVAGEEPKMGTIRLESAEPVRGGIVCIVRAENAQGMRYTKRIRVVPTNVVPGGQWDGVETGIATRRADGRFQVAFNVDDPGGYEVSVVEDGAAPIPAFVKVVEGWPKPPVTPEPQVITREDEAGFEREVGRMREAVTTQAVAYANARCASQSHERALETYRQAVIAAIRGAR